MEVDIFDSDSESELGNLFEMVLRRSYVVRGRLGHNEFKIRFQLSKDARLI